MAFGHRNLQTSPVRLLSVGNFKGKFYMKTRRSSEELKHNDEQNVANSVPETLLAVDRNMLEVCLRKGDVHF
jgi:hypothetical protein